VRKENKMPKGMTKKRLCLIFTIYYFIVGKIGLGVAFEEESIMTFLASEGTKATREQVHSIVLLLIDLGLLEERLISTRSA